jgi:hypothetical protein
MKIKSILAVLLLTIACAPVFAQGEGLSTSPGPQPTPVEPVDSSFVPQVESKVAALELVSVKRLDFTLRVRVKNVSAKNIYSFRMSYHKSGQSQLFSFIHADDKTFLAPGEIYKYDYPYIPNSVFAREPLTFEAVLFEDGTGDGVEDKVKSLQEVFLTNRKELEHVIAILGTALGWTDIDTSPGVNRLLTELSKTPDYMYGVDLKGMAGLILTSWKATAMGRVRDAEQANHERGGGSMREGLQKIKDDFNRSLAKYPQLQ